jgi:hypothetical protein
MEEGNGNDEGFLSKLRNQGGAFGASIQEGWEYMKASIIGQVMLSLSLSHTHKTRTIFQFLFLCSI